MAVVGMTGMFWAFNMQFQYQRTLPRHEDLAAGRTYPLNVHGIVVWQTRDENNMREQIEYSSVGILLGAIFVWQICKKTLSIRPD
jgi:hypothetical protein